MREMTLAETDGDLFQTLYVGALLSFDAHQNYAGEERLTLAVSLLDALESVSEDKDASVTDLIALAAQSEREGLAPKQIIAAVEIAAGAMRAGRALKVGGGSLVLEEAEYSLLLGRLRAIPWPPSQARVALRAIKLLTNTPKLQPRTSG